MKKLILSLALTVSVFAGSAGVYLATDAAPVASAAKTAYRPPIGTPDFRCFLCDGNSCAITNVGGNGCIQELGICRVTNWGCSEWPSFGFISIRW